MRVETGDAAFAEAIKTDYTTAAISERLRALLDFAVKVSREAWTCQAADLEKLRAHGLSDEEIVDAVGIIGFFNFVVRVADALGVELNPEYAHLQKVDMAAITRGEA
ncbi:MAG: carboxymuconolactone decarboxylase family protein [Candidatus Rokubacteria bacterium]|nr:carboxymuconolactone decarboxylase family protein [Candidatus Rokubacteria bacterium]MBI2878611.1 carboxymuconolactone decarboxylase family protein [Candidatus Rokubacteria bacterium]